MDLREPVVVGLAIAVAAYLAGVVGLVAVGRRIDARALLGFLVGCVRLLKRLIADKRVPRRHKLLLTLAAGYLLSPVDIVPDFIPVVGYADDALIVTLAVRLVLRTSGPDLVTEHWAGPDRLLPVLLRLADVSVLPGIRVLSWTIVAGAVGLALCAWLDVVDNCSMCRENDPTALITGRSIAVLLCVLGAAGLAVHAVGGRRASGVAD